MSDGYVDLDASPLAPGRSPVRIYYRDLGHGAAILFLHGGWGYGIYPFDHQALALEGQRRIVIPDRTGYGGSGTLDVQYPDFHQRAAEETLATITALGLDRVALWGHSDGAIIALRLALMAPARVSGIVAEATHYFRRKPRSREFFMTMRDAPDALGVRVASALEREHGRRWRTLLSENGAAWLQIADNASSDRADLYDGRLPGLAVPVLVVHGARDPRTEPGELQALGADLEGRRAATKWLLLDEGAHSPHSEAATVDRVTREATAFLLDANHT